MDQTMKPRLNIDGVTYVRLDWVYAHIEMILPPMLHDVVKRIEESTIKEYEQKELLAGEL